MAASELQTGLSQAPADQPPEAVSHDAVVPLWPQHPSRVPSCYARVTSLL